KNLRGLPAGALLPRPLPAAGVKTAVRLAGQRGAPPRGMVGPAGTRDAERRLSLAGVPAAPEAERLRGLAPAGLRGTSGRRHDPARNPMDHQCPSGGGAAPADA